MQPTLGDHSSRSSSSRVAFLSSASVPGGNPVRSSQNYFYHELLVRFGLASGFRCTDVSLFASIFPAVSALLVHLGSSCLFAPLYAHALIARVLLFSLCGQAQLGTPTLDVLAGEPAGDSIGRVLW